MDSVQRLIPPQSQHQGARASIERRRGLHTTAAVSPDGHLEVGHRWSEQRHVDWFQSLIFSSRVSLFAFLEAGSQNWGSFWTRFSNGEHKQSHHSYRLVTLSLTSPPGGRFSIYKTTHRIWLRILSTPLRRN